MESDVILESPERRIILDTKFYSDALARGRGSGTGKLSRVPPTAVHTPTTMLSCDGIPPPTGTHQTHLPDRWANWPSMT